MTQRCIVYRFGLLPRYLFDALLREPTAVDELARTAVDCALDGSGGKPFVVLDSDEIIRRSHKKGLAALSRN